MCMFLEVESLVLGGYTISRCCETMWISKGSVTSMARWMLSNKALLLGGASGP